MKMTDKFRKIKNISRSMVFVLVILFFPSVALAENKIDVEYPVGTDIDGGIIFDEDNILPGWETSKIIKVKNKSTTDDTNFYIKFVLQGNEKLAKALKLYVIRVSDGSYRIGGSGDRYTLKKADGERLYVDKLSKKEGEKYRIKIKFGEDAGNEYQSRTAKFKIKFTIESEEAGAGTEAEILAAEGRVVSGNPSEGSEGNEQERELGITKGEQTEAINTETGYFGWSLLGWFFCGLIILGLMRYGYYLYKSRRIV